MCIRDRSRASWQLSLLTSIGIAVGTVIPYTIVGRELGMMSMPGSFFLLLFVTVIAYMALVTALKKMFIRKYGELL